MHLRELFEGDRIVFKGNRHQIRQMERCCATIGDLFLELMPVDRNYDIFDEKNVPLLSMYGFPKLIRAGKSRSRSYGGIHMRPASARLVIRQVFVPERMMGRPSILKGASNFHIRFPNLYLPGYDPVNDRQDEKGDVEPCDSSISFGYRDLAYCVHGLAEGENKRIEEEALRAHKLSLGRLKKGLPFKSS